MAKDFDISRHIPVYVEEMKERVARAEKLLLKAEKAPGDDSDIKYFKREMHTIKGTSAMMGFANVEKIAHVIEDMADEVIKAAPVASMSRPGIDDILRRMDELRAELKKIESGICDGTQDGGAFGGADIRTRRTDSRTVKLALRDVDELSITSLSITSENDRLGEIESGLKEAISVVESSAPGSIVPGEAALLLREVLKKTRLLYDRLDLYSRRLGELAKRIRLIPLSELTASFPRIVRDIAKEDEKEVELNIDTARLGVDGFISEDIQEAMLHIVRNAVRHGIEKREERLKKGKPACGRINIAAQLEKDNVVIRISDDGRGIPISEIRSVAVEKGILGKAEASSMKEEELIRVIFSDGLSSDKRADRISGRGVGLSAVKASLEKVGGHIDVTSEEGKGTMFLIAYPLTIGLLDVVLFDRGGFIFAVPERCVSGQADIGEEKSAARDIVDIKRSLRGASPSQPSPRSGLKMSVEGRHFFIVIDKALGKEGIVLKKINRFMGRPGFLLGCGIMAFDRVCFVLDVKELKKEFIDSQP